MPSALGTKIKETKQPVPQQEFWEALEADGDVVLDDQPHHSDDWDFDRRGLDEVRPSPCTSPGKAQEVREPLLDDDERERLDQYNRLIRAKRTAWRQECTEQQKMYTQVARKPFRSLRRMPEPGLQMVTPIGEDDVDRDDPPSTEKL